MNQTPTALAAAHIIELIQSLAPGMDTPRATALLDELFRHASAGQHVSLSHADGSFLLRDRSGLQVELPLQLAKTKMRSLCFRLQVLCDEWLGRPVPLDDAFFVVERPEGRFQVSIANTTARQEIQIVALADDKPDSPIGVATTLLRSVAKVEAT